MLNCAQSLKEMNDYSSLKLACQKLQSQDDFEILKAVKFIVSFGDEKQVDKLYEALKQSHLKENIACEIPYLVDLLDEVKQGKENALFCFNCIIDGLGEILPLCEIFNYKVKQIINYLSSKSYISQNEAVVILNTMLKFDLITQNNEYTFDENKITKNELNEIQKIFENFKDEFKLYLQKILIKEIDSTSIFLTNTLNLISEFKIYEAKNSLIELMKNSNECIICEVINTLKNINGLDNLNQDEIINKINDSNIKAIVKSCF